MASLALAALLGAYADVGQYARGFWGTVPEAGTPWVLMAFLGGSLARRPLIAALAGAGLILVGLSAYVGLVHFAYATSLYNITTDGRASSWEPWRSFSGAQRDWPDPGHRANPSVCAKLHGGSPSVFRWLRPRMLC